MLRVAQMEFLTCTCVGSVDMEGTFEAKGVHKAAQRLKFIAAEVREPFPAAVREAGVDTLVMKHFLSGFSDADARTILKHCKEIMPANGKILLLQTLVPEAGDRQHNVCRDGVAPGNLQPVACMQRLRDTPDAALYCDRPAQACSPSRSLRCAPAAAGARSASGRPFLRRRATALRSLLLWAPTCTSWCGALARIDTRDIARRLLAHCADGVLHNVNGC